jgi:hypothetical protein
MFLKGSFIILLLGNSLLISYSFWHAYEENRYHLLRETHDLADLCQKDYTLHHLLYHDNLTYFHVIPENEQTKFDNDHRNNDNSSIFRGNASPDVDHTSMNFSSSEGIDFNRCPCYSESTKPYSYDFIEMLSLWPHVMNQYDIEHGETIYGSKLGLELIYQNQNPPDCKKAKYLVSGGWPYGFGSRYMFFFFFLVFLISGFSSYFLCYVLDCIWKV